MIIVARARIPVHSFVAEHDGRRHHFEMRDVRRILAGLVAALALVVASVAVEDCGSAPAAAQDASADGAPADAHSESDAHDANVGSDAQLDDAGVVSVVCPDPDGGYYITVNGDGPTQILSSSGASDVSVPWAFYQPPCGGIFVIAGSASPDGGSVFYFQYDEATQSPPPTLGPTIATHSRGDGTYFSSAPDFGQPTYSELGAPGGVVAGSYAVTVATSTQPGAATLSLSGTFCTLRLADGQPRPCPP